MYHDKWKESLQTAVIQSKKSVYLGSSLQCFIKASSFLYCSAGKVSHQISWFNLSNIPRRQRKEKKSVNIFNKCTLGTKYSFGRKQKIKFFQWEGTW